MSRRRHIKPGARQKARTAGELEVGGCYSNAIGDSFYIVRRSANGKLFVGRSLVGTYTIQRFFTESGQSVDGELPLHWLTISGHGVSKRASGRIASREWWRVARSKGQQPPQS